MRVSSRIDGSICGAIFHLHRPSLLHSSAAAAVSGRRGTSPCRYNIVSSHGGGCFTRDFHGSCTVSGARPQGHIRRSRGARRSLLTTLPALPPTNIHDGAFFRPTIPTTCENHTAAAVVPDITPEPPPSSQADAPAAHDAFEILTRPPPPRKPRGNLWSKDELLALVEPYDAGPVEEHLQFFRDPYMRGYAPADGPNLTVSVKRDDVEFPSYEEVMQADEEQRKILWELRFAVLSRLRNPLRTDLDTVYEIYQRLPEPRMPYIYARLRHQLLKVLGQPEKKDSKSMLRYFAVIADVKNSGMPLTAAEWNSAISFASRYVGVSTEVETESALKLWREMEQDAGIKGTDVTFNILFDVASKAGNFTLAEMIYKEMEARGHRFNRYHYVSLIHFFGLKLDTAGLRAAYREMVNAGEIIDTVALNCVIAGLLRSGEEEAADRVYERMKLLSQEQQTGGGKREMPARTYVTNKAITQVFLMFAKLGRRHPSLQPGLQRMALIHPDLHTYRVLVNHYGVKMGDLARVAKYLDEMKFFQIPLHGAIFLALFKGFYAHGGYRGSAWSEQRLNSIWQALLDTLDEGGSGIEIKTWLAIWVLRAFKKCAADPNSRVLDAYEALKMRWSLDHADEQFMIEFLASLVNK
ncbi:hypothetical protein QBC46DRAFT_381894 [Diplogelasinospora grovesii]|uniref:Pentatricopeptide repeat protein n=1 Tax=Diplogelasinospora grovesii TaxID=303347 RepID=A0AAN6S5D0_9PEZI|nr:hypothetical protein QBC46DRAFT_381894 [Diplogelasinospora grovesii]